MCYVYIVFQKYKVHGLELLYSWYTDEEVCMEVVSTVRYIHVSNHFKTMAALSYKHFEYS